MIYHILPPSSIRTSIQLPASKSISNRALIIHALGKGDCLPENLSDCDDTRVMVKALTEGGDTIDILAAGTAMRFLTAYFSITPGQRILTGTARMQQRPIQLLVDALRQLGADIAYTNREGFPPLRIRGKEPNNCELKNYEQEVCEQENCKLKNCEQEKKETLCSELTLQGNVSSQYISALLMIGPMLPHGLTLHLSGNIISRPYIDLTLQLMGEFGAKAEWTSESTITVHPQPYHSVPFTVESDWSAASYWYEMAALSEEAEIELTGLFPNSYQGDSRGHELFSQLGVETAFTPHGVKLTKSGQRVERMEADLVDIPDLAQTFVVTCALLNIPFRFTGLQSLKIKETDRITALRNELRKLGYAIEEENDSVLYWNGERCEAEVSPLIATYEDHRMAMAFAPAALCCPSVRIAHPHVVSKSYPRYWDDLRQAGFRMEEEATQLSE
ncbi:3-phosphoshikimate 1-carboxyvinyltransferase [uncultured Bacteroides sp.]|jgi:3-phosphoshikimate 1-carboxyvinyltransferase|uniref:3-phosphoshikimate 1-carboxyvinyltransferase n=1 Tax=uncultured Bacteroides sp. TaxID=162156 RepID=UPI0025D06FC6|nr:3-phosphoshikimate 1-carboxyvinyltransferase [uncultured Bacteroides sp.]